MRLVKLVLNVTKTLPVAYTTTTNTSTESRHEQLDSVRNEASIIMHGQRLYILVTMVMHFLLSMQYLRIASSQK